MLNFREMAFPELSIIFPLSFIFILSIVLGLRAGALSYSENYIIWDSKLTFLCFCQKLLTQLLVKISGIGSSTTRTGTPTARVSFT